MKGLKMCRLINSLWMVKSYESNISKYNVARLYGTEIERSTMSRHPQTLLAGRCKVYFQSTRSKASGSSIETYQQLFTNSPTLVILEIPLCLGAALSSQLCFRYISDDQFETKEEMKVYNYGAKSQLSPRKPF